MRGLSILLLSLTLAPSALADVDFGKDKHARDDLELITTCFDAAETWEAAQDCVDLTYKPCIERLGREPNRPDQDACIGRELEMWKHLLANQTRKLEAWALHKDNEIADASGRDPQAHVTFLRMEANWSGYLEAQCDFRVQKFVGGSIGSTVVLNCENDLVVERLFGLRPLLLKVESKAMQ
jgi:uncharacterized protein YecT (DUF1311 family)